MKIFITGVTGYIGSHTCVELLNNGYEVVGLDNFSNSKRSVLDSIKKITNKEIIFYEGDMLDKALLQKIFSENNIDMVIDFAAYKAVGESVSKPIEYYINNVSSVLTLLSVMKEFNVKSLIFSSSATVYGTPKVVPITEECETGNTTNPYGTSKLFVEQILKDLCDNLCKNYEKNYNDLYMNTQELTSLFVLFNYAGIKYNKKCEKMLTAQETLPEYSEKHADIAINFLLDSNLISDFEKSEIKNILRKYEVYENKNASLDLSEKIKKTLTSSMSKLDSISRIVEIENESLKEKLRMLILTDFIKKDSVKKINTTEDFDSISIVSIFEVLRRQNNDLRLGVLSGAIVILPSDLKDNIKNEIEINESEYSFKEQNIL